MAMYHRINLQNGPVVKSYMNRPLPPITADIFSQAVSQLEPSQYVHDSFCVSESDEIVYGKNNVFFERKTILINDLRNFFQFNQTNVIFSKKKQKEEKEK